MNAVDEDFVEYCRQCTDEQLKHVLKKEWDAFGHRDYTSARIAAAERGWRVDKGERVG
jgi:hypothetical protein